MARHGIVAALALAAVACDLLPDRELAALKRSLTVEITQVNHVENGGFFFYGVDFKLSNNGESIVVACLGPSRTVSYTTPGSAGTLVDAVDHPGCIEEFTLQARATTTWREEFNVGTMLTKGSTLQVSVEIVNPKRCGGFGCSADRLRSNLYAVP